MGLALAFLERLAIRSGDHQNRNCDRLAPARIPTVLEMEEPPSGGQTLRVVRSHRSDPQDELGQSSVRVLEGLRERRGAPAAIQVDNGTEFTSRVVDQWAYQNQVALHFIERGKPTQNALIESFNGKFRDECLNQNWFVDLGHARAVIEAWRVDYNTVRPHSSLAYRTPEEFAEANGCGKDSGFATLDPASGDPLSHSHGDGPLSTVAVESTILEANL